MDNMLETMDVFIKYIFSLRYLEIALELNKIISIY